jgi:hypothetical protein
MSEKARLTMRAPPGPPMTIANMRANGVRAVTATCANCGHAADVNVDLLPETHRPRDQPAPPMQPQRRQDHLNQTRLAHEPPPRHARLSTP